MEGKFLIFLVVLIQSLWALDPEAGHGEPCNIEEGLECSKFPGLVCLYKTCSCLTGQGFQWDSTEERCVGRVGSSCGSPEDCIGNSTCVDLYCECESGFSRDIHGNCRQVHGEKCDNNSDCNEDVHLFCSDGNCRCVNDTTRVFESGYCGSLFGEPCDPLQDFFGFPTGQTGNKCQGTLKCQKKESGFNCGCPSGTQLLEDRTCGIPAGSPRWEITSLCLLSCVFYHFIF